METTAARRAERGPFIVRHPRLTLAAAWLARRCMQAVAAVQGAIAAGLRHAGAGLGPAGRPLARAAGTLASRADHLRGVALWMSGLGWWLGRHREFVERARRGGIDVLFVGDSLTDNWRTDGAAAWRERFEPLGAENFGIGGDRTRLVLWRLQGGELEGIDPRVVVLLIGANDVRAASAEEVARGVAAIVDDLGRRLPGATVLLISLLPQDRVRTERRLRIERVNEAIATLHDGRRVHYLDAGRALLEPDGTLSDRVMGDYLHLTPEGYGRLAEAIHGPLVELLGENRISTSGARSV